MQLWKTSWWVFVESTQQLQQLLICFLNVSLGQIVANTVTTPRKCKLCMLASPYFAGKDNLGSMTEKFAGVNVNPGITNTPTGHRGGTCTPGGEVNPGVTCIPQI